jgi:hypothetical protein
MLEQHLEAEAKLQEIAQIFMFAMEAYLYSEYFHKPDTSDELEVSTNSPHAVHLTFIRHVMYRTLVVELAKLFSRSQHDQYRLQAFIQTFKPEGVNAHMKIPASTIDDLETLFFRNVDIIQDVINLRNKVYAHTDKGKDDFLDIDLSFGKIQTLLSVAECIIQEIYRVAFDTTLITDSPSFERKRFGMLKLLAKAEKQRKEEIFSRYRIDKHDGRTP